MQLKSFVVTALVMALNVVGVPTAKAEQSGMQSGKKAPATATAPVNLNAATSADLENLPGIGPAVAKRILEYRQKNGGFKKIEDLMNVKGIGEKLFLKLKPLVAIAPPRLTDR